MEILENTYLTEILHIVSTYLLVPTVIILLLLIVYALYTIGSIIVEAIAERRYYRAVIPELLADINAANPSELNTVIDKSGMLRAQKDDLDELVAYLYLPEDARNEVAKRLLANEELRYQKVLERTEIASKIAPMLGLMGTLIPLGPGIVALSTGDTETLSGALLVAFDTTVAGLASAVVCFVVSKVRRRWYSDYLVSMEAVYNTLLEKGEMFHKEGYKFEKAVYRYNKSGRKAHKEVLGEGAKREAVEWDGAKREGVEQDSVKREAVERETSGKRERAAHKRRD